MADDKVRENRLRRMAERQGLALHKSPRRDPRAVGYGRYALVELHTLTLDDVERRLTTPTTPPGSAIPPRPLPSQR